MFECGGLYIEKLVEGGNNILFYFLLSGNNMQKCIEITVIFLESLSQVTFGHMKPISIIAFGFWC